MRLVCVANGFGAALFALFGLGIVAQGCGGGGHGSSFLGAAGAAGSGGDNGAGGSGTTAPVTCQTDKECRPSGGLCDTAQGVCVECLIDLDCGTTQLCRAGSCEDFTPCTSSKECAMDEVCDRTAGRCVECVGDNDCCSGQASCARSCVANVCRVNCTSDKECTPDGLVCDTTFGHCVECVLSTDCPEGKSCVSQSCQSSGGGAGGAAGTGGDAGMGNTGGAAGGSGGSTGNGGSGGTSSGPLTCADPRLVDDFEDGDNFMCNGMLQFAAWRQLGGAAVTVADSPAGRSGSLKALHIVNVSATGFNATYVDPTGDARTSTFDASAYQGVEFWAQGNAPIVLGIHTSASLMDFDGFVLERAITAEWGHYQVLFADMAHYKGSAGTPAANDIAELQFFANGAYDIWIDDVAFIPK